MNLKKPADYSAMFAALDRLMAANLPQMELYREIGRLVNDRPEKGAAAAAAEYLCGTYPNASGFSPRNLRRMREFYRAYENAPEVMAEAMTISWTQNVVILEAGLTPQEKTWYVHAAKQFGWSKLELQRKIAASIHLEITLDFIEEICYTEKNMESKEMPSHDQAQDNQCDGIGNTGSADGIPSFLCLLCPAIFDRRIHTQPLLVRRGNRRPLGMVDGDSPPGYGSL